MNIPKPNTKALRQRMSDICAAGPVRKKKQLVAAIFQRWSEEDANDASSWRHGSGKRTNAKVPNPDQKNPLAAWAKYEDGTYPQNFEGWSMVAEILSLDVSEIIQKEAQGSTETLGSNAVFRSMPGEAPLFRLANLDVLAPSPMKGRNAVNTDQGVRQALALSIKPIFGTLRNEVLHDSAGNLIATANVEAVYAHVVINTVDQNMDVLDGIGFHGEYDCAETLRCRYGGEREGQVFFEISPASSKKSLAGTSLTMENFVALEGEFRSEDWIGVGFESGGLQIQEFSSDDQAPSSKLSMREQIKRQVLNQGINLGNTEEGVHNIHLSARRFFMKRAFEDADGMGGE